MKNLNIGDAVRVRATASMEYDEFENRIVVREPLPAPFEAIVTGQARRMLGKYQGGSERVMGYSVDYNPPCLDVTGSVLLWCVRTAKAGKERLVRDEDLEAV